MSHEALLHDDKRVQSTMATLASWDTSSWTHGLLIADYLFEPMLKTDILWSLVPGVSQEGCHVAKLYYFLVLSWGHQPSKPSGLLKYSTYQTFPEMQILIKNSRANMKHLSYNIVIQETCNF